MLAAPSIQTSSTPISNLELAHDHAIHANVKVFFPEGQQEDQSPVFSRNELFIAAPSGKVWSCLVRAKNWPQWYGNAKDVEIDGDGDQLRLGTCFHWTTFGIRAHTTITEFVPNERLSWRGKGLGATAYHGWVVRACEGGCYVVTEETQQGFVVSLARNLLRRGLLKWHQRWLEGLARVAAMPNVAIE